VFASNSVLLVRSKSDRPFSWAVRGMKDLYLPVLLGFAMTCVAAAPVSAQGGFPVGAAQKAESGRPGDSPNTGEVFFAPPVRWEYWCTCKCGNLYHRMDVPTRACEDLNTTECVLDGRKLVLEDCARRLTPRGERLVPP
jgi:hypothetical protein